MAFFLYNRYDGTFESVILGTDQNPVVSTPPVGQYRIKEIRLDADKKLVIVYDTTAQT